VYEVVKVNTLKVFNENLRYVSADSYASTPKYAKKCTDGNFYNYTEIDSVCPVGTHLMTNLEWDLLFSLLARSQDIPYAAMNVDDNSELRHLFVMDTTEELDIFNSDLIDLSPNGWVQGRKIKNKKTLSLWVLDFNDPKMHVHIGPYSYQQHKHDHHIIDDPKRMRKFQVRCVLDDNTPFILE